MLLRVSDLAFDVTYQVINDVVSIINQSANSKHTHTHTKKKKKKKKEIEEKEKENGKKWWLEQIAENLGIKGVKK